MKLKFFLSTLLASTLLLSITSCARQISSNVYAADRIGEISTTYPGIVRNVRQVCVAEGERLEDNSTGLVGGAVAGGLVGNACGGRFLPTAVGAVAGAIGGSVIEKNLKQQTAFEYIVEIENGGLMTIVQGTDSMFCVGQSVYVIISQTGRSRIIYRN
jgi:outer membrane lipoprotein SlyB